MATCNVSRLIEWVIVLIKHPIRVTYHLVQIRSCQRLDINAVTFLDGVNNHKGIGVFQSLVNGRPIATIDSPPRMSLIRMQKKNDKLVRFHKESTCQRLFPLFF